MDVTVITPTIPERTNLLAENIASVASQKEPAAAHLVGVDLKREGPAVVRNRLLDAVDTEWVTFLDDDDILFENHYEVVMPHLDDGDLIYTWCTSVGRGNFNPNSHFNEQRLRREGNFIPITVNVRTEFLRKVGGFSEARLEDWDLWIRLLDAEARFLCVPTATWCYRFLGNNRTFT